MKKTTKLTIICAECGREFTSYDEKRRACSWECRNKLMSKKYKGKTFTQEHKDNIKKNHHDVSGDKNPKWNGGVSIRGGYRYVLAKIGGKGKPTEYVREHRMIMNCPDECHVHHINRDKLDNRPENLMVMTQSEHNRLHVREDRPVRYETLVCSGCGTSFESPDWDCLNESSRRFCSRECYIVNSLKKHNE